ncbi:MAG: hypothetical protein IRZ10_07990 [Thermoflavifilum sp.]|nr:hypothetical protein [Thermoflavifilum sp.]MCL6514351.1 hypothetical protein [Alicyclobacillus sp.]
MSSTPVRRWGAGEDDRERVRRGKIGIIVMVVGLLALGGAMMAAMRHELNQRLAHPGPSFEKYVQDHHLGTVTDVTDGTATDPSTTVLTLYEAIPNQDLQRTALEYMRLFVEYDQGQSFVLCEPASQGQTLEVALCHYDPQTGQLVVDLRPPGGQPVHLELQENW